MNGLISTSFPWTHEPPNFILFHKERARDNTPSKLTTIKLNNVKIKRVIPMKFLGVIVDENIFWKLHIGLILNEMSKNMRTLKRA